MLKRLLCLLVAMMMLCPALPALAEDGGESALDWEELIQWAESYKERAMNAQPMNDPTEAAAYSEDGYAFIYDFATLYMDRPEMTEESVLKNLVITTADEEGPRGTCIDMLSGDVLTRYYNENERLEGDEGFATLYVSDTMPSGALWAWVQRDGQRIMTIQYAVHEQLSTGGDGYTDAGLVYTIQDNLVAAIRAYGLDSRVEEEDVQNNLNAVEDVMEKTDYAQAPVSYIGTDLTAFGEEDLSFAGISFLTVTPEEAVAVLGECREDSWMEDDTGEYLRTMEFADCEITFVYDSNKENPRADMITIDMDGMEGPRYVRVGDTFSSVLTRFRYGEGVYEGTTEILYGQENQAPCGIAEYGEDASATLRYLTRVSDGRDVMMYMEFELMSLKEILIYIND